jgi:hypothetical protein
MNPLGNGPCLTSRESANPLWAHPDPAAMAHGRSGGNVRLRPFSAKYMLLVLHSWGGNLGFIKGDTLVVLPEQLPNRLEYEPAPRSPKSER